VWNSLPHDNVGVKSSVEFRRGRDVEIAPESIHNYIRQIKNAEGMQTFMLERICSLITDGIKEQLPLLAGCLLHNCTHFSAASHADHRGSQDLALHGLQTRSSLAADLLIFSFCETPRN